LQDGKVSVEEFAAGLRKKNGGSSEVQRITGESDLDICRLLLCKLHSA